MRRKTNNSSARLLLLLLLVVVFEAAATDTGSFQDDGDGGTPPTATGDVVTLLPPASPLEMESAADELRRMIASMAAKRNPAVAGGRRSPPPPLPVKLVSVDVRRVQYKSAGGAASTTSPALDGGRPGDNSTNYHQPRDVQETIDDQLYRDRIRRKQFRILTILKEINDRIGGPRPSPPGHHAQESASETWNSPLADCAKSPRPPRHQRRHGCEEPAPLTDIPSETTVSDVFVISPSCVRRDSADSDVDSVQSSNGMESGREVKSSDDEEVLRLEFSGLVASTRHCRSGTDEPQTKRARLAVYVRGSQHSADQRERHASTPRLRRRHFRRLHAAESDSSRTGRRQRKGKVLLISVFQKINFDRNQQRTRLKPVGQKRVRKAFSGWLRIKVEVQLTACRRRRRGSAPLTVQPLVLILRVTDYDRVVAVHPRQLISAPKQCDSLEQMKEAADIEVRTLEALNSDHGDTSATHTGQPYLEVRSRLHSGAEFTGRHRRRLHHHSLRHKLAAADTSYARRL